MYTVLKLFWPLYGNCEADVAPRENEFDTPALGRELAIEKNLRWGGGALLLGDIFLVCSYFNTSDGLSTPAYPSIDWYKLDLCFILD